MKNLLLLTIILSISTAGFCGDITIKEGTEKETVFIETTSHDSEFTISRLDSQIDWKNIKITQLQDEIVVLEAKKSSAIALEKE